MMESNYDKKYQLKGQIYSLLPYAILQLQANSYKKQTKMSLSLITCFLKEFFPMYFLFIILDAGDMFLEFPVTWRDLIVLTGELRGCYARAESRISESFHS